MGAAISATSRDEVREGSRAETPGFAESYREHGRPLYGMALRMLRRPEDAEDAVQEAFLSLYRKAPELPAGQTGPWLRRVLVNQCIDRLRRGRRWQTTEVDEAHHAPLPAPPDGLGLDLEQAVARLPEKARMVFLLHDVEGFKHREMAEMLGLATGTTKSQLMRARALLRVSIQGIPRGGR